MLCIKSPELTHLLVASCSVMTVESEFDGARQCSGAAVPKGH